MSDLAETLGIKDFDTMVNDVLDTIIDSDVGITDVSVGSVTRTLVEAILNEVDMSNYYAQYVYGAMSIDNATGDDLDNLVSLFNITRNPATYATGIVTFSTGDSPATSNINIPYGTTVSTQQATDEDGTSYSFTVTDVDLVLPSGASTVTANVICETSGAISLSANTVIIMSDVINGINSVTNTSAIIGGKDAEDDDAFRIRTKEYIDSFGKCTEDAIKIAVNSVDGVLTSAITDLSDGYGTFKVLVTTSDIPAPQSVKDAVELAIKQTKASGIHYTVLYPTVHNIAVSITIVGLDAGTYGATVKGAISAYANSLNVGQKFIVSQMERKILNAIDENNVNNDEYDITTTSPSANVSVTESEVVRISSITLNGEVL